MRPATLARASLALLLVASPAAALEPPKPDFSNAIFVEQSTAFIPYANDVPIMTSAGVRLAKIHEMWLRGGYVLTGDDIRLGFGATGYRVVLRPEKVVRPFFGGLFAGLPETCSHDMMGNPTCTKQPIFIWAGVAGLRIEPLPPLGINLSIALGIDSYANAFGMVELGFSLAYPLGRR